MRKTFATAAATAAFLTATLGACDGPEDEDTMSGDATGEIAAGMDGGMDGGMDAMNGEQQASATLYDADGEEVGGVIARQTAEGVLMNVAVTGLPEGSHGAHIHEFGTCEPDFMAAGEHWAPFDQELNLADDDPTDDSENAAVSAGEDGAGELRYSLGGAVTLAGLMEGDGSSFVLHQRSPDPAMETPSGEGDRIACGVFEPRG